MRLEKGIFTLLTFLLIGGSSFAQEFKFTLNGYGADTVYLARYFGPKPYYADTSVSNKNGVVVFDGSKHEGGLMGVVTKQGHFFEFINDSEKIHMKVDTLMNPVGSMTVLESPNNKAFYEYIHFMTEKKQAGKKIQEECKQARDGSKQEEECKAKLDAIDEEIKVFQNNLVKENEGRFIATMVNMAMDVELPEPPKDENGAIKDSNFVFQYYMNHYWDNTDLTDERIIRTPVFHNKLDRYFSKRGVIQIPDSIFLYAQKMIDRMGNWKEGENKVFQYTAHHITNKYESSKIMGMDRVFVLMAKNYYCEPNNYAWWVKEETTKKICERAEKLGRTMVGEYAPLVILPDSTEENWINSYEIDADYTILYFWDPNCGHCKKVTPKLQTLYERKFKDRNIEVMAVGKATGDDFEKWKKFIVENNLSFINVGLTKNVYNQALEDPRPLLDKTTLESLNYSDTWDIYSTPRLFVLDKDKKIRFKQLSMSQLEDIMDKITGHEDDPKIYPIEEEPEDEKMDQD